jgi:hypothetical protein
MAVVVQRHASAALLTGMRPRTHCTGDRVGLGPDCTGEEIFSPPRFGPRTVQPIASRYTDYAEGLKRTTKTTIKKPRSQHETSRLWNRSANH